MCNQNYDCDKNNICQLSVRKPDNYVVQKWIIYVRQSVQLYDLHRDSYFTKHSLFTYLIILQSWCTQENRLLVEDWMLLHILDCSIRVFYVESFYRLSWTVQKGPTYYKEASSCKTSLVYCHDTCFIRHFLFVIPIPSVPIFLEIEEPLN